MNKLIVSPAPHVHSGNSIRKEMVSVLIALIPAYLVALYYFGVGAIIVSVTSVISCVIFEYFIQKFLIKGENTVSDYSAVLTGLLLSFNLPSNLPVWIVVIGALVAIGVGKMSFGGLGNNPFNPALVGRVFLLISFPVQMTSWPRPMAWNTSYLDAETSATALSALKEHLGNIPSLFDMFVGNMGGSMGEVSALALLLGFVYLLFKRTITWHIPVSILLTVFIMTGIFYLVNPQTYFPNYTFIVGRINAGSYLYGHRLCYFSHDKNGNDNLRHWHWYYHCCYQNVWFLSRRSIFCYPYHECVYTTN